MRLQLDKTIESHRKLDELLKEASVNINEVPPKKQAVARELLALNIEQLRRHLASHPELWRQGQDMAAMAIDHFIDQAATTPGLKELMRARALAMRADLGAADASVLVRMLIDAVVLAHLRWIMTDLQHTNLMATNHHFERGLYWEKRLANAQRQYLRACEALARVRKLSRNTPELQHDLSDGPVM